MIRYRVGDALTPGDEKGNQLETRRGITGARICRAEGKPELSVGVFMQFIIYLYRIKWMCNSVNNKNNILRLQLLIRVLLLLPPAPLARYGSCWLLGPPPPEAKVWLTV